MTRSEYIREKRRDRSTHQVPELRAVTIRSTSELRPYASYSFADVAMDVSPLAESIAMRDIRENR